MESRRELLRESLKGERSGGFTTHAAKLMAKPLGGEATGCTLTAHCRTFGFEFPRSQVISEETVKPVMIFTGNEFRAAIVCDLSGYFEKTSRFPTLRHRRIATRRVQSTHKKSLSLYYQSKKGAKNLFLVIEECMEFAPTVLSTEQCFTIDEVRDGVAMVEGGREGKRAVLAFPAVGCPWPDFEPDMYHVNVVLAAVKSVQNVTGHVTQLCEVSCYVNDKGEAIYTLNPTMSARAVVVSRQPYSRGSGSKGGPNEGNASRHDVGDRGTGSRGTVRFHSVGQDDRRRISPTHVPKALAGNRRLEETLGTTRIVE